MCAYSSYFFMLLMHEESNVNKYNIIQHNGREKSNRACNIIFYNFETTIYYC